MKKRKLASITAVQLAMVMLMSGCMTDQDGSAEITDKTADEVNLRVCTMFGGTEATSMEYEKIKESFQSENPNVILEDDSGTADEEWKQRVTGDFSAGNEPDVIQFFTDATANDIVDMNKFVTVDEIRKEYPEYGADITEKALKNASNTDGVSRALPTTGYWEGLYCNKDMFDKYNIELPTNWDSFLDAVHKFRKNNVVPVACSMTNVPHYWMEYLMLYSAGEEEYTNIFTEDSYDLERGLETFQLLKKLEAFPDNTDIIDNGTASQLFINKEAAMILEGNWFLPSVEDQENTVVVPFPGVKGQKAEYNTVIGGMTTGFYITRRAWDNPEKRDAAVKYVMANTSYEAVQEYWLCGGGSASAAVDVEPPVTQTPLEKSATAYMKNAGDIILSTDSRISPQAYQILVSNMLSIYEGASAEKLLDRVAAKNIEEISRSAATASTSE